MQLARCVSANPRTPFLPHLFTFKSNLITVARMPLASTRPKPAEAPVEAAPAHRAHPLPSSRKEQSFGAKVADPFSKKAMFKTSFGQMYSSGNIPCVVNHGSIKNKLQWKQPPQAQDYDPLLILVAEGLCETDFPFNFIARNAFKELLEAELGGDKAELVLPRLIAPLRLSLMSSDMSVVEAGMDALMQLSLGLRLCSKGDRLNEYLPVLLVQLTKRPQLREKATRVLELLEQNGGKAAYDAIKSKVPTYCSVGSF